MLSKGWCVNNTLDVINNFAMVGIFQEVSAQLIREILAIVVGLLRKTYSSEKQDLFCINYDLRSLIVIGSLLMAGVIKDITGE